MKIRRLPETDLARFAVMTPDKRRAALERHKTSYAPYSYNPMRGVIPAIFDIEVPLLGRPLGYSWEVISGIIATCSKRSDAERTANLLVGELLFKFSKEHGVKGRGQDFYAMPVGMATAIRFWSPVVIAVDGKPVVPFIDPRKAHSLDAKARRFVLSVMHERIRVLDPDYREVGLGIFQFPIDGKGRKVKFYTDESVDLYDFETLDLMVRETYEMWREVLAEREEKKRRGGGTGTYGPLFD
ncbi:MAG: hypothetical protein ABII76_12270 [Pseudomonadota bacterium]